MPRRTILTDRQRSALVDLPVDETSLRKHYTLADDDLEHIGRRRRAENRLGFALQLCALRHPGGVLQPGELIPSPVVEFIGVQLGIAVGSLLPMRRGDRRARPARRPRAPATHLVPRMGPHPAYRRIQVAKKTLTSP